MKETLKKMGNAILNFFKKGWTLLIIPIGLFIIRLFTSSSKSDIKEQKAEIKEDKKDVEETTQTIEEHEEKIAEQILDIRNTPSSSSSDSKLEEILPGLKK